MRPSIDIDKSLHGRIKSLAETLYDGDTSEAYNHVLGKGLTYTATPTQEPFDEESAENPLFIETGHSGRGEDFAPPILFHRSLSINDELIAERCFPVQAMGFKEFNETLRHVSRFSGVYNTKAAFGIRRRGGVWCGWGFGNFVAAYTEPMARYEGTRFEELRREELCLIFEAGRAYVAIRARPNHNVGELQQIKIDILFNNPTDDVGEFLRGIMGQFGIRPDFRTELQERIHANITHSSEVSINRYLVESSKHEKVTKLLARNTIGDKLDKRLPNGVQIPNSVVVFLQHHPTKGREDEKVYHIERVGVTEFDFINISARGTWHNS